MRYELFYLCYAERPRRGFNLGENSIPRGDFYKGGGSANIFGWAEGPAQGKKVFPQITLVYWRKGMVFNQTDCGPAILL